MFTYPPTTINPITFETTEYNVARCGNDARPSLDRRPCRAEERSRGDGENPCALGRHARVPHRPDAKPAHGLAPRRPADFGGLGDVDRLGIVNLYEDGVTKNFSI